MGRFVKGDVVVIPFPYSDLSASKKRPALVVTSLDGDDGNTIIRFNRSGRNQKKAPTSLTEVRGLFLAITG